MASTIGIGRNGRKHPAPSQTPLPTPESPCPPCDLVISYVSADEPWAHWIFSQLQSVGHRCRLLRWNSQVPDNAATIARHLSSARHLVVLFSDSYHRSALASADWLVPLAAPRSAAYDAKASAPVVLLRISELPADGPLAVIPRITLHGHPVLAARKRLLDGMSARCPVNASTLAPATVLEPPPPFPADLPAIWHVPLSPDPRFVGRDTELTNLARRLSEWRRVAIAPCTDLDTPAGIGKTQLALQYAWQRRDRYDAVLWINAANSRVLLASLAALSHRRILRLPEADARSQAHQIKAVLAHLQTRSRTLLIFDGVNHQEVAEEIERLLARVERCHVLMTSRLTLIPNSFSRFDLTSLDPGIASAYLERHANLSAGESSSLAASLKHIPLNLQLATALRRHPDAQFAVSTVHLSSPTSQLMLATRCHLSAPAAAAFRLLCLFNASPLPRAILDLDANLLRDAVALLAQERPRPAASISPTADDLLGELARHALIVASPWQLQIHPAIRDLCAEQIPPQHLNAWNHLALRLLQSRLPASADAPQAWAVWEQLRPALDYVLRNNYSGNAAEPAAGVMVRFAAYLEARQLYSLAEPIYTRAITTLEHHLGADHVRLADILAALADMLARASRYPEAERLLRRSLDITEKAFGPEDRNTINRTGALGMLLFTAGRLADAEQLFRRVLDLARKQLGSRHVLVATAMANLAELLRISEAFSESEQLFRKALEIDERELGPEHLHVARDLYGLAEVLRVTGHQADSEPLYFRAFAIEEKQLGADHPRLLPRLTRVAEIMSEHHRYADAEPLFRRLVGMLERHRGPEHADTGSALNSLGVVLAALNRPHEAETAYRRAAAIAEAAFGPDHHSVAACLNNLGGLYETTRRLSDAEPLYRRVMSIFEKTLSPNDSALATVYSNLANALAATHHVQEAETLYRRAIDIDEKVFGPAHPKVAIRLSNLGSLLHDAGRNDEAEWAYRRALTIDTQYLGNDDPAVGRDLNNLGNLLQTAGKLEEAEWYYKRSLEIEERVYGKDHPNIASRLNNLADVLKARGRHKQAEPLYRRVIHLFETSYGPDHGSLATAINNLASLLKATHRFGEAEPLYRRALAIDVKNLGADHPKIATRHNNLAGLLASTDRRMEAETHFRQALDILRRFSKASGRVHPDVEPIALKYYGMLVNAGLTEADAARRAGVAMIVPSAGRKR